MAWKQVTRIKKFKLIGTRGYSRVHLPSYTNGVGWRASNVAVGATALNTTNNAFDFTAQVTKIDDNNFDINCYTKRCSRRNINGTELINKWNVGRINTGSEYREMFLVVNIYYRMTATYAESQSMGRFGTAKFSLYLGNKFLMNIDWNIRLYYKNGIKHTFYQNQSLPPVIKWDRSAGSSTDSRLVILDGMFFIDSFDRGSLADLNVRDFSLTGNFPSDWDFIVTIDYMNYTDLSNITTSDSQCLAIAYENG